VLAALAGPVRLAAQDQPQAKPAPLGSAVVTANYNFLIGSGLLCSSDDSTACPAVAKAANGETIEISGAGTLNLAHQSITAAGAFTQKTPTGDIVSTGVWAAAELESFESYGLAPGVLQLDYPKLRAFGPFAMGLGRMAAPMAGMMAGPVAAGGLAVIRIRLRPDAGSPAEAVLQVNCAKGKVPPGQPDDGVTLIVQGGGPRFDAQVSGRTVFLLRRPGPNAAWNRPTASDTER
jgi:hypothetical protein